MKIENVKLVRGESHADYLARPGLSFSALKTFIDCPEVYEAMHITGEMQRRETEAMSLGTALHALVLLGPQAYAQEIVVTPEFGDLRRKANREKKEAFMEKVKSGACVISQDHDMLVRKMAKAVVDCGECLRAINFLDVETTVTWTRDGISCKGRPDSFFPGTIVDLKTTNSNSADAFLTEIARRGYARQMAWYCEPLAQIEQSKGRWCANIISVPKVIPCVPRVFHLSCGLLEEARRENEIAVQQYRKCLQSGIWISENRFIQVG